MTGSELEQRVAWTFVLVGWGLDFVWPFLLKYPRNKIAVIDQVWGAMCYSLLV